MSTLKLCIVFMILLGLKLEVYAQSATNPVAKPSLTVQTTTLKKIKFLEQLSAQGNLAAWQEVVVGTELSGVALKSVRVDLGEYVEKGAVLATLDDETLILEQKQAQAAVDQTFSSYQEARSQENRAKSLLSQGFYSQAQYDLAASNSLVAQAHYTSSLAKLDLQIRKTNLSSIRSPESGKIVVKPQQVGGIVAPGIELFRLVKLGRYEWRAEVGETELHKIVRGQEVTLTLADGLQRRGMVRSVDPSIASNSRLGLVYVDILGPSDKLKSGMSAQGKFKLGESSNWGVSHSALLLRDGFYYLYLVEDNHKVKQVKIQIGRRAGDSVEVLTPLPEQSKIVSSGAAFLTDGDVVKVLTN